MDLNSQVSLEHLLFKERECRSCGEIKELILDYYLIRKSKKHLASSYSYECKDCTIKRITSSRTQDRVLWEYPDW